MFSSDLHHSDEHEQRPVDLSPGRSDSTRAVCGDGDPWAAADQPRSTPIRISPTTANPWAAASALVALRDPSVQRPPSSVWSANPFLQIDRRTQCPYQGMSGTPHHAAATRPVNTIAGREPLPGSPSDTTSERVREGTSTTKPGTGGGLCPATAAAAALIVGIAAGNGEILPPRYNGDTRVDADDWAQDFSDYIDLRQIPGRGFMGCRWTWEWTTS